MNQNARWNSEKDACVVWRKVPHIKTEQDAREDLRPYQAGGEWRVEQLAEQETK